MLIINPEEESSRPSRINKGTTTTIKDAKNKKTGEFTEIGSLTQEITKKSRDSLDLESIRAKQ